jgi:hypothetical protein
VDGVCLGTPLHDTSAGSGNKPGQSFILDHQTAKYAENDVTDQQISICSTLCAIANDRPGGRPYAACSRGRLEKALKAFVFRTVAASGKRTLGDWRQNF